MDTKKGTIDIKAYLRVEEGEDLKTIGYYIQYLSDGIIHTPNPSIT